MRIHRILCFLLLLSSTGSYAQSGMPEVQVSDIFEKGSITIVHPSFMVDSTQSFRDTVRLRFYLVNDLPRDTMVHYLESLSEWFEFVAIPDSTSVPLIRQVSGRRFYDTLPYDDLSYPTQHLRVQKGVRYECSVAYTGNGYRPASETIRFLSPDQFDKNLKVVWKYEYTNHIITYFFIGAICFGFFFFFFLYLKSRYALFGMYSGFLFLQAAYASYQVDMYTLYGQMLLHNGTWDDWLGELLVFIAQALYVQFMIRWMNIKNTNRSVYRLFNSISIFFLAYALSFTLFYHLDSKNIALAYMEAGMRLASILIMLIVFYVLIFKIRTPVKNYIITGSSLLVFFGVIMVFLNNALVFQNSPLDYIDNGSWYMIGLLAECLCFSMGLGLRYFQIDQENLKLSKENIIVLEDKLKTEMEARENENKVAVLNQELTNQQLTALRAQMNPHFIFNALNSIQKYIVKGSVDEANSYLSKFSKLQRMILSYCDENFITLDKEIDMLTLYLEIEQLRLSHEFTFDISMDDDIEPEEIMIPPMMLQPFVENAIWHGLVPKEGAKKLNIHFGIIGQDILQCIVDDNGVGRKVAQRLKEERLADRTINRSKGMSLVNERLEILERKYGKGFSVEIRDKLDAEQHSLGTTVELNIPVTD